MTDYPWIRPGHGRSEQSHATSSVLNKSHPMLSESGPLLSAAWDESEENVQRPGGGYKKQHPFIDAQHCIISSIESKYRGRNTILACSVHGSENSTIIKC